MIAHCSRDADAAGRTFGLKPRRDIHHFAVDITAIWNHIANIDADAKPDRPIGGLIAIMGGDLLLYLHGTAYCPVHAIEYNEQGVTSRIDDSTAMLVDSRVYQSTAERPKPFEGSNVIQPNQAAETDHIGMEDGNKLPPIRQFSMRARWLGHRHDGQSPVSLVPSAVFLRHIKKAKNWRGMVSLRLASGERFRGGKAFRCSREPTANTP